MRCCGRCSRTLTRSNPQREALLSAFGMSVDAAPDRFLIALAALELLSEAASRTPLVLIVEDSHWLDAATADALAFVAGVGCRPRIQHSWPRTGTLAPRTLVRH